MEYVRFKVTEWRWSLVGVGFVGGKCLPLLFLSLSFYFLFLLPYFLYLLPLSFSHLNDSSHSIQDTTSHFYTLFTNSHSLTQVRSRHLGRKLPIGTNNKSNLVRNNYLISSAPRSVGFLWNNRRQSCSQPCDPPDRNQELK